VPQKPPRKHHYVPQLLLRRFVGSEGKLWVYDLERGDVYPGRPETSGFTRDLYSRVGSNGMQDHATVEKLLSERIDGPGDAAIRRLLRKETLGADWNDFLMFVAAQLNRTPAFFDRVSKSLEPAGQEAMDRIARTPEFRESIRRKALERGESEEGIERFLDLLGSGGFRVTPTKDFVMHMALVLIYGIFEELRPMHWQVGTLADSDTDLIVGDHPVLSVVPSGHLVGMRNPEMRVKLPLSRRVAAIGSWCAPDRHTTFDPGAANTINEATMRFAKRFLFASYRSDSLLEKARALYGTGPKECTRKVQVGKGVAIVTEYRQGSSP
jgi:hypothetical protein